MTDKLYPTPQEGSGLYHYSIACPWCSWRDESDKGSLGLKSSYEDHMDRKHIVQLTAWRKDQLTNT